MKTTSIMKDAERMGTRSMSSSENSLEELRDDRFNLVLQLQTIKEKNRWGERENVGNVTIVEPRYEDKNKVERRVQKIEIDRAALSDRQSLTLWQVERLRSL